MLFLSNSKKKKKKKKEKKNWQFFKMSLSMEIASHFEFDTVGFCRNAS